jgi:hypothetical protein
VRIEILSDAQEDFVEGFLFYERQDVGVGSYFLDCLFSDIDGLSVHAGVHAIGHGHHRALSNRFPFAIYHTKKRKLCGCMPFWLLPQSGLDQATAWCILRHVT